MKATMAWRYRACDDLVKDYFGWDLPKGYRIDRKSHSFRANSKVELFLFNTNYCICGYWNDRSANLSFILVGLRVLRDSFVYREYGIRLMLVPRSDKGLQEKVLPNVQGIRELSGSLSLGGTLFWIIAGLTSLRKADEICSSLFLLLMSSLRNLPYFGILANTSTRDVSTSNTRQQSLADADSETRPSMLERGSYMTWAICFRRYLNQKRENKKWLNKAIDEGPYEFKNYTPLDSLTPRMQTEEVLTVDDLKHYEVDRETRFNNEFDQFVAEPGEALVSIYNRFAQLINDLEQNGITFPLVTVNTKNTRQSYVQEKFIEGNNVQNDGGNIQRTLRTTSSRTAANDEARVTFIDEQNDFLVVDATRMEDIEELSENICLMAKIQPSNIDSDVGPSYDSTFLSEVQTLSTNYMNPLFAKDNQEQKYMKQPKIINNIIGDDQIDSNIIFDEPNVDVNSSSVEQDNNVQASYALEQLALNAYKEAEEQQINANKVKQKNKVLTQQLELYKEKLSVVELKSQVVELQKTQKILKRKMSENKDKYHDTVLDLEAKDKENENVVPKIGRSLQGMFMLGLKPMSFYESHVKHGLSYENPYTLKKEISQNPKLYDASYFDDTKIHVNVSDTEDILDDATKSQTKMENKLKDLIAIEKKL
nr:hypothetical protein [Tanacetum cinerariifolium]